MTDENIHSRYAPGKPFPETASVWGAGYDDRDPPLGWKRVPGCCRVVNASIPDPLPFYAPAWCGPRGVPTSDGRVFDCETGHEMRDFRSVVAVPRAMPGSMLKQPKTKK